MGKNNKKKAPHKHKTIKAKLTKGKFKFPKPPKKKPCPYCY